MWLELLQNQRQVEQLRPGHQKFRITDSNNRNRALHLDQLNHKIRTDTGRFTRVSASGRTGLIAQQVQGLFQASSRTITMYASSFSRRR